MKEEKIDKCWNKAVKYYNNKFYGMALIFCSGETIRNKALEFYEEELK
jgi:hypothetical protein